MSYYKTQLVLMQAKLAVKEALLDREKEKNVELRKAVKYYKDTIIPILKVSDDYGVDFYNKLPFEDFGSDDESFFNTSFTDYYKNILKEINIDNICTDNRYRITAWDNLDAVIDTISTIIKEEKEKNKDECELN